MQNTKTEYGSFERTPVVLPEMEQLLPPLSAEQFSALEGDILENGCYAPIIVNEDILPAPVLNALKEYKETVASKWMFPSPVNEDSPRDPAAVRKRLQTVLERAGCKKVRFHDLCHPNVKHKTKSFSTFFFDLLRF